MGELPGELKELLFQALDASIRIDQRVEAVQRLRTLSLEAPQPSGLMEADPRLLLELIPQASSLGDDALTDLFAQLSPRSKHARRPVLAEDCIDTALALLESGNPVTQELTARLLAAVDFTESSLSAMLSPNLGALPILVTILRGDRPAVRLLALDILLSLSVCGTFSDRAVSSALGLIPALGEVMLGDQSDAKAKAFALLCRITQSETNASFLKCRGVAR